MGRGTGSGRLHPCNVFAGRQLPLVRVQAIVERNYVPKKPYDRGPWGRLPAYRQK